MIKIFFIINCFSKGGGAESLLTSIVNHLNPEKYEIGIMEIIHDTIKEEPVNNNIKRFPYFVAADDPKRKLKMYDVYHEWDKVIAEYIPQNYDLYVSFNYLKPSFLLPPGRRCISWMHGDVYNLAEEDMAEERELQNRALYKTNRIVSISDITTQSLVDLFPEHKDKLRVIYNGIDINSVRSKAKEPTDIVLQHPAIISVGRLDNNKNPLRLLNIFEKVYEENTEAHLYYLGNGALENEIKKTARAKGLENHVHLLGYYENPLPVMAQCDVCGMFSIAEGFPMSLLECVALSKPFVSSLIGGARILADNESCGRIVETDEEAARAILMMLSMDKEQLKKACNKSIARFELGEYIRRLESLFDEVMEDRS